jgi:hypothetical protein
MPMPGFHCQKIFMISRAGSSGMPLPERGDVRFHSKVINVLPVIFKFLKSVRFLVPVRVTIPEPLLTMQLSDSFLH